ncbi:MAG TPA: hypothetical protein VM736_04145 [Gemmatimonadales bacterium]|nr:hypothetical protein [Gemmatimonadales bacterium]
MTLDSIAASDTVSGAGGPATRDGYAVNCNPNPYCTFYRPGAVVHAAPVTTTADLAVWGFGIPGLSVHASGRAAGDLSSADHWPGTGSHVQLLEGYAQYAADHWSVQLGRQTVTMRFGFTGFDGGRATLRDARHGLELTAYGGWGLWRSAPLPVTSPALNPLDEFRPPQRTLVAGAGGGWSTTLFDTRLAYEREVDPSVSYFVSERVGASAVLRPGAGITLAGGADYDIAQGWWGSAEATLGYVVRDGRIGVSAGLHRYRPHFDLWTIWGAFSPVPYTAVEGTATARPLARFEIRVRGQHYRYANTETATPLVQAQGSGWRFSWTATYTPAANWVMEGGYRAEFGPGAASRGFDGEVTYAMGERLSLSAHAATLDRPLEFRYDRSSLDLVGLAGNYQPVPRLQIQMDASRYAEDRARPDAGAFSWDQVRLSARVVLLFGGGADLGGLPPAVRGMPEKGAP